MICSLCGNEIIGKKHSANPIKRGQCCEKCNTKVILPLRVYLSMKNNNKALVIKPNDEIEYLEPKNKKYFTLKELQNAVGGYIELYPKYDEDFLFVINEEGLILRLELNSMVSDILDIKVLGNLIICPKEIFEEREEYEED